MRQQAPSGDPARSRIGMQPLLVDKRARALRTVVFSSSVEHHGEEGHEVDCGARGTEDRLSRMFSALADPTRRDIVVRLASGGEG